MRELSKKLHFLLTLKMSFIQTQLFKSHLGKMGAAGSY